MSVEAISVEQRASNGFEFLSLRGPEGWRERINRDLLDIDHGYFCVLGQVYAEEAEGEGYEYALGELAFGVKGGVEDLVFFGFYSLRGNEDGPALTKAWRALLAGETEPVEAPVVHGEEQVKEDQCGYQSAYGLPWSEFCIFPKGEDSDFCPGHERDHFEQYGRRV
ncbi:hypothetical protein ABZ281_07625 [Streptomyces sp. NPDC006265]|uniref:hypothetical protein n=1 Tax=Streptomyces sp. NPDC006265 TaxID=3156740 RepID=UPI0033BB0A70